MPVENNKKEREILTGAHHDYAKGLNAYAYYKMQNHETGDDLVQTTFLKTWKYLVKGGKVDIMKAFLYHILNHLIIDEYRKHKTTSLDAMIENGFEPGTPVETNYSNALSGKMAFLLIDRLPEKYAKIMRMRYIQNLSIKEISILLGQTKNSVTVQTHRGLAKLKLLYDPT
jgi:RNA polymerase sigma-70 factor (ECF subfamily)